MDDQRTDRAGGGGMSREIERRRMEAILMSFVGVFFIFAGALTLWNGAPADGVFMFLSGYILSDGDSQLSPHWN
jgi:hypothetical protein